MLKRDKAHVAASTTIGDGLGCVPIMADMDAAMQAVFAFRRVSEFMRLNAVKAPPGGDAFTALTT